MARYIAKITPHNPLVKNPRSIVIDNAINAKSALDRAAKEKDDGEFISQLLEEVVKEKGVRIVWDHINEFHEDNETTIIRKCKWCDYESPYIGIDELCDGCWELFTRIERQPDIAKKMIASLNSTV